MFPRNSVAPRGRGSFNRFDLNSIQFYEYNHQPQLPIHSRNVPGQDRLHPYRWKAPQPTSAAFPQHTQSKVNRGKRQHNDHSHHDVKRQRLNSPAHPPAGFAVNLAPPPPHYPKPVTPETSRSFNSFDNSHCPSPLNLHSPAAPDLSNTLQAYVTDKVSDQMMKLFEGCQQQSDDLVRKESCRFKLQEDIRRRVFSVARLYMTGSSMNGLGCRSSDADLCLVIKSNKEMDPISVLSKLQKVFKSLSYVDKTQLIRAKVPILRFREKGSDLEFDLNVNNTVGIRNTFLLKSYACADLRIRPLILAIKKWARHNQINDASKGTLSSYTLVLMALHYLQILKEPVLPSLQRDFPECFDPIMDLDNIPASTERIPPFSSRNRSSLGELFLGFLRYYTVDFRWDQQVISIREARAFPKTNSFEWRNKYICVEEPFERKNVARAVHEKLKFDAIRVQFTESWWKLHQTKDLNSILPVNVIINRESNWR